MRSALLSFLACVPLAAQTALTRDANVRSAPNGAVIAVLKAGTTVTLGERRGDQQSITFDGWLDGTKLGAGKDGFDATLTGPLAMRLRSAPSMKGVILGEVRPGAGVARGAKQGSWTRVTRSGWVGAAAVGGAAPTVAARPA
ncbi:MAG: hypothetical protein K2X99_05075, partial [Gemmatimonadaceae bacterium]|nr:hypothetical protein [Gemmatimonadaceae bacterium]